MFDIQTFADIYGIDLHHAGEKNVSNGWVNINCPFCLFDKSWHLGMSLSSGAWSCWKCGHKSGPQKVVQALLHIGYNEACVIVDKYQIGPVVENTPRIRRATTFELPSSVRPGLTKNSRAYLIERGFDPDYIINEFHVMHGEKYSKLQGRIVIPIFLRHTIVNYVARDFTGKAEHRYILCSNEKAGIPRNDLLYHFDHVHRVGMAVEGPTDVWAIGRGAFATFGTRFSSAQLAMIAERQLEQLYIVYDEDAHARALDLAAQVASIVPVVEIITLDHGDPAAQPPEIKAELKNILKV